jgi:hypothetical protein
VAFLLPERYRVAPAMLTAALTAAYTTKAGDPYGMFQVPSIEPGWMLFIIANRAGNEPGDPWDHVSVHVRNDRQRKLRTPSWKEMCQVKDLFWEPEDVVVQFHPRQSSYVNHHPHTLHLWRNVRDAIPEPEPHLVGPT